MAQFSHLDESGKVRMVDVTQKSATVRMARARGHVRASPETLALIQTKKLPREIRWKWLGLQESWLPRIRPVSSLYVIRWG